MKNRIIALFLAALMMSSASPLQAEKPCGKSVFCFDKAAAFEHYIKRPRTELSKLIYLKDILQKSDYEVVYNGKIYNPDNIISLITMYVRMNYRKEKAENWITQHAYRSASKGQVIYLKDPQGNRAILKDVLLQELRTLPA